MGGLLVYFKNLLKQNHFSYCLIRKIKEVYIGLFSEKTWIERSWHKKFNQNLSFKNVNTYNEKIQWLKVYGKRDQISINCADKLKVRDYVKAAIGKEYLNELIGVYASIKDIHADSLPLKYVLKTTHDSGSVLIKKSSKSLDINELKKIECSLSSNYSIISKEWVYGDIKPQLIIEKFLESDNGKSLKDYKVFCFDGEPKLIQVDLDRFEEHKRNFYNTDWEKLDLEIEYPSDDINVQRPNLLNKMLELSKALSGPFIHARIDWYISNNKLVFGEITFFHGGGFEKFSSKKWENILGNWIKLD